MDVELVKDRQGLVITIAGYTAADRSGMVSINDQIVEVDGLSLQGFSSQQAVEMLRSTGRVGHLKIWFNMVLL